MLLGWPTSASARVFQTFAHAVGLYGYHLPDMDEIAEVGARVLQQRSPRRRRPHGGRQADPERRQREGPHDPLGEAVRLHAVVGRLRRRPVVHHRELSAGHLLPIETNGDGAVNVYSRVQMLLFKAKQLAQKEVDKALADVGMTIDEVRAYLEKHPSMTQRVPPLAAQGGLHGGGPRLRGGRAQEPPVATSRTRSSTRSRARRRRSTRRRT